MSFLLIYTTAPGVEPPNIQFDDFYSSHSINVTWDAIPQEEENGYMVGYKIPDINWYDRVDKIYQ